MSKTKLLIVTALVVLGVAGASAWPEQGEWGNEAALSSDPEWQYLSAKGTDVAMEELTLAYE